jgi:16S rRNA (guanine527-N7)-methyltransferase
MIYAELAVDADSVVRSKDNSMTAESSESISPIVQSLVSRFPVLDKNGLSLYLSDIVSWNRRIPLVSRKNTISVLKRLVIQSLLFREFIVEHCSSPAAFAETRIVDIGTGAGFPGLIWKMIDPGSNLTLVERNQKKATFLQREVVVLGMDGVEVVEIDAHVASARLDLKGSFDLAVSFAVGGVERVSPLVDPFLRPGGWYATQRPLSEKSDSITADGNLELTATRKAETGNFCLFCKSG